MGVYKGMEWGINDALLRQYIRVMEPPPGNGDGIERRAIKINPSLHLLQGQFTLTRYEAAPAPNVSPTENENGRAASPEDVLVFSDMH